MRAQVRSCVIPKNYRALTGNGHISAAVPRWGRILRDNSKIGIIVGTRDAKTPEEALARALTLIQDDEASDTVWYCCDRQTGTITAYRQEEFDPDY